MCALAYFNVLGNGFLNYDDHNERILKNPFLLTPWSWSHLATAFTQATAGYYDPVYVLSYVIDHRLWGWNPAGFHFDNLLLHTANSVLVFFLMLRLRGGYPLALVSSLLFAVHPIHVESVAWATSRKDVLSMFFALASFRVYLQGRSGSVPRFTAFSAASFLLLLLGMMTKPTVGVLPALILVSEILLLGRPVSWKRAAAYQAAAWTGLALFVGLTLPMTMGEAVKPDIQFTWAGHTVLFLDLYAYFMKLILFPVNLSAFYRITVDDAVSPGMALFIGAFLLLIGWGVLELFRALKTPPEAGRPRWTAWGVWVYLVGLLPFTNILPRTIYLADRYEYLASLGFCAAVAAGVLKLSNRRVQTAALVLVLGFYTALTLDRVPVWKDSPTLWADVDRKRNISPREHHRLMAESYAFHGQWDQAVAQFEKVGLENLKGPDELLRVANIYFSAGKSEGAERLLTRIVRRDPEEAPAWFRLIVLHLSRGEHDRALSVWQVARKHFTPQETELCRELIRYDRQGRLEPARRVYGRLQFLMKKRRHHVQQKERRGGRSGA